MFFIWYLSNEKTAFVDKSRVESSIFFIEKISFSLKLFSGHFYGQSFIKTVRGPLKVTTISVAFQLQPNLVKKYTYILL